MLMIEVDAGCRETWGYMGIGAVAFRGEERVAELSLARRGSSSTTAELLAIGHGLKLAAALGDRDVCILTDCKTCMNVLNYSDAQTAAGVQRFPRQWALVKLINHWRELLPGIMLTWMPRHEIQDAHELATLALERYRLQWGFPRPTHSVSVKERKINAASSS